MNETNRDDRDGGRADSARGCGRSEELVAYLYGEARPAETRAFRAHLDECAACREESAVFGGVRESIALFRHEAEAHARPLDLSEALEAEAGPVVPTLLVPARSSLAADTPDRRRSARAALREFFRLSPLWLRAGAATAALVVCALAALMLARSEVSWDDQGFAFRTGITERAVTKTGAETAPASEKYTREQVEAIAAERVAGEVAAARGRWEAEAKEPAGAEDKQVPASRDGGDPGARARPVVGTSTKAGATRRRTPAGRNTRRPELAAEEEDDLPRLSDLLGGAYE